MLSTLLLLFICPALIVSHDTYSNDEEEGLS
jgi:hypothetical protein